MAKTKPKDAKCKCGCDLTVAMCEVLFRAGVPSEGLTMKQGGFAISKISRNDWTLPEPFLFLRNEGEWEVRKWLGKPDKKS